MRLTEVVEIWGSLPSWRDEKDCSEYDLEHTFGFADFVAAIHEVVGVENDIPVLGGCK